MSESFSVGEIAVIHNSPPWAVEYNGTEVEVIGPLIHREWFCAQSGGNREGPAYVCAFPHGEHWCIRPIYLRKRRLPPTREQVSTWDDVIVWKPCEVTHV